jgi:hypothetical protein
MVSFFPFSFSRRIYRLSILHFIVTHLAVFVTHLAVFVTHLAVFVTHLAVFVTHLAVFVTHLAVFKHCSHTLKVTTWIQSIDNI